MGDVGDGAARRDRPRGPSRHTGPVGSSVLTPPTGLPSTPERSERRDSAPVVLPPRPPAAPQVVVDPCVCRHARDAHEHWRRGSDCGICGPRWCSRYRRRGGVLRRFLRRLHLVG